MGERLATLGPEQLEAAALDGGVTALSNPSSITAEGFYRKLGYVAVRDGYHGEECTIVMERGLVGAGSRGCGSGTSETN